MMKIEEELGIKIPEDEVDGVLTIGEAIEAVLSAKSFCAA
jgi:acyl carrier protein